MTHWTENRENVSRLQRFLSGDESGGSVESLHESTATLSGPPNENDVRRFIQRLHQTPAADFMTPQDVEALARSLVRRAGQSMERLDGAPLGLLSAEDAATLEAVVNVRGRPAVRVLNDRLEDMRVYPQSELWMMLVDQHRSNVMTATQATAAVRVHDRLLPHKNWVQGTAVMIGPNLALTNRHVMIPTNGTTRLARRAPGTTTARLKRNYTVSLDFAYDGGPEREVRYKVVGVPFLAADADPVDAALLQLEPVEGGEPSAPPTLSVSTQDVFDIDRLYVIGHPGHMPMVPQDVRLVFGDPDERKRVSFGMLMDATHVDQVHIVHDASTIGGFSGGGTFGFDGTDVMALHYWGDGVHGNRAIAARALRDHSVLGPMIRAL